jgi:acetylornithine deacetylase/succinyl-diaminopimelate desuccinylase-like protein
MNRTTAVQAAYGRYDSGALFSALQERVSQQTVNVPGGASDPLLTYLQCLQSALHARGFATRVESVEVKGRSNHFLVAERIEDAGRPTVLMYGHGDVVTGMDAQWSDGLNPWRLSVEGDRWYGRGTADNKGQHTINLAALDSVLEARNGQLGFNVKLLIEMGEEVGSPGMADFCLRHRQELAADLFLASDGPRLSAAQPTIFLGSRGIVNFKLRVASRALPYHSGNWGGLLRNPATTLAAALSSLVDGNGVIRVAGLRPQSVPESVKQAVAELRLSPEEGDPAIDDGWGEPGFSPEARVFTWNALEVLALDAGNPVHPVNAIPAQATAHCQLRFVVGTDWQNLELHVRQHLDAHGFGMVEVQVSRGAPATRLDPKAAWVRWAETSIETTTGKRVAVLPNLGGTLPNEIFAVTLGLPTVWVPHSYPGCSQHSPNEHLLGSVAREGLGMMAGLFWDLGEVDLQAMQRDQEVPA